ncbi:MAG: flagellar basal-body MS-ring/collar protein FliF, partial [Gemmataceae bacterium]|nr:flagellar basal-body MS-ring/collar protein FliF [Gemmataceae bacterium]
AASDVYKRQPLASGVPVEESGAILAQLESASIPYRLENGGSVILVPEEQLAKARVELASKGVMSRGGKGYELFDEMSLGATPFVQNVTYLRALQAELARSIMQLEPVASARVLIARAEPTPFLRDQQPTTASVVIKLKPGMGIHRSMAAGIVSLVARSVEGLRPENVTVVDSTGRLLSEPSKNTEGLTASELEVRRELEEYLSLKAEELLARHLGAGRALVRVSADLSRQKVRETRETYSPEDRAVRSEQIVSSESGGPTSRGVAGVASNTGTQPVSASTSASRTREETTYTDYLVSKTTREMESRFGDVQRLSVAVVVELSPREGAEVISIKDVEEIVKQAVGFQAGRDSIKVTNAALAGDLPPPEPVEPSLVDKAHAYVQLARNASVVVAFVFLALTVFMLARRLTALTLPLPLPSRESSASALATATATASSSSATSGLGVAVDERNRFIEMALADPRALAEVLSELLRGGPEAAVVDAGEAT